MREIEKKISLQDYIRVLLKRKWIIFTVIITALLVVLTANSFMSPVYKATTTILISQVGDQQAIFGGVAVIGEGDTTPAVGTHTYPAESVVNITNITTVPSGGCYSFTEWSGDITGTVNPTTVSPVKNQIDSLIEEIKKRTEKKERITDANKTVTANFEARIVYNVDTGVDYSSIQVAIDAAVDGQTIVVCTGTYSENIVFDGRNIIVRSSDPSDPAIVAATII